MKRCALLLGLVSVLALPAAAHALGEVMFGNQPIGPESGLGKELLAAVNVEERVYYLHHDWYLSFNFKGTPKAVNEALLRFAAIPADRREIRLLPAGAKPPLHGGEKPIDYDWCLRVPGHRRGVGGRRVVVRESEIADDRATLTVYIPEPSPVPPADPKAARAWIADLDRDDFKTRDRAARGLAALGPPVAALLREALKGRPSAEARDRLETLLAGVSTDLRPDVLKLPAGVPVVSLDGLLTRARKGLASPVPTVRGDAAWYLADHGAPAAEVLPDFETLLKTDPNAAPRISAARAACRLGPAARPLLPLLRDAAQGTDKDVAYMARVAVEAIEKGTAAPVSEADAKRWAAVRKGIREVVAGLDPEKAGK